VRRSVLVGLAIVAALTVRLSSGAATLTDPCSSPGWNVITCENSKPGTPSSSWSAGGAGDATLQGFSTDISVNHGQTISFKITDTNGSGGVGGSYRIDIYRVGYYQGNGARLQATIASTATTRTNQPACQTEASTGLIDCGNWSSSASWAVPATAVSGLYFANLVRDTNGANSHIYFIVRDDERHAPILFQTSDETWEAYNNYGGNSLYVGTAPTSNGRAWKVSYNRPLVTGNNSPRNEPLNTEYPMIRFLERNGYDVSYFSEIDTARSGAEILNHKTWMSVGHDEYWSAEQRNNVVAARNAGVNLAFFSGNEIFWKTRFAASITTGAQPWRTVVCYKESKEPAAIDPANPPTSTGAWRDPRFGAPADGAKPENAVSGQMYMVDAVRDDPIKVPFAYSQLRFWSHTSIASLTSGQTATLPTGTLGYEWDEDVDNGSRPAGLIDMSSTTVPVTTLVTDSTGQNEGSGNATHHLTLYRASSGALVFGAGTVQWSWGLDDQHTLVSGSSTPPQSPDMQQATVNLLADMSAQPATLQSGLVTATKSTDATPPTSTITYPTSTTLLDPTQSVTVTGTASDTGGGVVAGVEVSTDGGSTWHPANGTTSWSYTFTPGSFGQITIKSRATDDSANIQSTPASVSVSVGSCPCNIFGQTVPANPSIADPNPYELGVKFRSDVSGFVTGVRFYKGTGNTGTHVGHLWTSAGGVLGTATFTNETATGWQQVSFGSPIAISANTTYVASYFTPAGNYAADRPYFATNGVDVPPLHALMDGVDGPNGVYASGGGFPTSSFQATNYYVDVVFNNSNPPSVNAVSPTAGKADVASSTAVTATFSQPMNATTINTTTMSLRDSGGTLVPATVSYDGATNTATLTPNQPLPLSTTYTATIKGGSGGVTNSSGTALTSDYTWSFTTATPAACPCTIFPASATPGTASAFDSTANELGVKFRSDEDGYIRGIRFYKGPGNTGTHIGHLWSSSGAMLAEITFTGESAGGWQQVDFPRPVAVTANTTYVASYLAPNGGYALDRPYFTTGVDRSPMHALADGISGPNGVFAAGGGFPTQGSSASNYWVDVVFDTSGADRTPPVVTSVSPPAGATAIATSRATSVTFNEPLDALSVTTSNIQLKTPSNAVVPATVTYDSATQSASLTPSSPLALSTTYTLTVKGGAGGVTDTSGNALSADFTSTFTTGTPAACPCNLFGAATPTVASTTDTSATEVGIKFRSDVDGYVTGIRFYKGPQNTGTHVGYLWSTGGVLMGSATFTSESANGWQQVSFSSPISIRANTTYIAAYFAPNGGYALDRPFFSTWVDRPPLHALADGVEGADGVFASGQGFPTQSLAGSASNYWVDPVFDTISDRTPPTVTSRSPAPNATGVIRTTKVTAVFSEMLDPTSVGTSSFQLRDASGAQVPSSVTYDSATTTATLTPASPLTAGGTYTATVSGGSGGVRDTNGIALASDVSWSFTISSDVTPPTTTIACNTGSCANWFGTSPVTVSLQAGDNAGGSGVDKTRYTIDGSDPTVSSSASVYSGPFTVTTTTTLRYASTDLAGNVEAPGSTQVRIDTSPPSTPTLSFGALTNASATGSTVYYNPTSGGGLTVTGTSTDAESGIASVNYPTLGTGWSRSAGAYTFGAGASDPIEPNNVTATNNAGLTSAATSFTVTPDGSAPATALTCNGGACPAWSTSSPVTIALNASDTGSGVAATYYTTDGTDPSVVHGNLYAGAFTVAVTTTIKFRTYDKVGNAEAIQSQAVKIDTTPPSAPSLAFGGLSGAAFVGGVLYFSPSSTGGFTLTPTSTDAESGVATYNYPSLGTGWSRTNGTYTFVTGASDPVEPNNVTATNNAGLTSAPTSLTVTADTTAPATSATCNGSACSSGWYTTSTVSLGLTGSDTGSGVKQILYSTDGTAPSLVYSTPLVLATTTTVKFQAVDNVGNTEALKTQLVQIDSTAPTAPALTITPTTGSAVTGSTVFYNPAAAGGFNVVASSSDPESGIAAYNYPSLGIGWSNSGGSYSFAAGTAQPSPASVTATNNASLTSAGTTFSAVSDSTAPTTTVACSGGCTGWHATSPVTITLSAGDGTGSGIDRILYSTDGSAPSQLYTAPFTVASTATVKFASYDRVGNLETAKSQPVQIDTTPPSAPSLALGGATGSAAVTGGVLFFNPASSGGFTVTPTSTDVESGVASYTYPSLGTGWTRSTGTYTFTAGAVDPAEPNNVTATNNAGLTSAPTSFTVTADTSAPATTVNCNGAACGSAWYTTSPVSVTLAAADSGSGVAKILYSTDGTAPSLTYSTPLSIAATTTVKFAAVDKVGNTEATQSQLVQVDTTAPSAPTLSLGAVTGGAAVTAGVLYFNPASSGGFTVTPSSTDPQSGVASYSYPSFGNAWSNNNGAYSFTAAAVDPTEPNNVTALNNAGLTSAPTSFTVTADGSAPATTVACNGGACPTWSTTSPVSVTLGATDTGSGVAATYYTTDGTDPSSTHGQLYAGAFNVTTTTALRFRSYDKVGNAETIGSQTIQIDTTAPAAPALALSESSPYEAIATSTLYYNPSGTNTGSFDVLATTSDAESGIAKVTFPAATGMTGGGDVTASPYQTTYNWSASATATGSQTVTARNNAGFTASATFTLSRDTGGPTGGSITYADGFTATGSITITTANGTDSGAGLDTTSGVLQRDAVALNNGTCGTFAGNWTTATSPDATLVTGTCYRYRYLISDKVGNTATYTSTSVVKFDSSGPATPTLTLSSASATQFITGTTIFYANTTNGNFTVTGTSSDAESGIKQLTFPAITGMSGGGADTTSPYQATYSWTGSTTATGQQNVTATNNANLTSPTAPFTVTLDNTAPTLSITSPVASARIRNGVVLTPSVSETGSGIKQVEFRYCAGCSNFNQATAFTGNTATSAPYTVTWNNQPADGAYVIFARVTDNVGNVTTTSTGLAVTIDNTPPLTAVSLVNATGAYITSTGTIYMANTAGAFSLHVDVLDPQPATGVKNVVFPAITNSGWTGPAATDTTAPYEAPYSFGAGAAVPTSKTITTSDNAGNTQADTVTFVKDQTAPTVTLTGPAGGAKLTNGAALSATAGDSGSGIKQVEFRYCPGATCTFASGTTIGTATTSPYTVAWNSQPADGTYTIAVQATDNVGNTATDGTATVTLDNSGPTTTLNVVSGTRADLQFFSAGTLYYNPSATSDFAITETATDPNAVASVAFPAITQTGFNGTEKTATTTPYVSNTYTFDASNTAAPAPASIVATDGLGNRRTDSLLFVLDQTGPTGGSVAYPNGYAAGGNVSITTNAGTDGGAGVAPATGVLERQVATLAGDTCGTFGSWTPVTSPDSLAPATCAQYRYRVSDRVGNQTFYTSTNVVKYDASAPSAPALSFDSFTGASAVGSTIYFNPAAAGGFTVTASSTDAESGVPSYAFPSLGSGWTNTNGAYTFAAAAVDPAEPNNVTATNGAGLASAPTSFTVNADATAPVTTATCNAGSCAGWSTSTPVSVALSASDGGSGVDKILYSTDGGTPSNVYTGPISVSTTTTVKFAAVDKVGNLETAKSQTVQIDTTAPSAPSLSLGGTSGSAVVTGGVLYFNPASSGAFTVTPSSTDAESGVASYGYPTLGSGWTNANGAYSFVAGATDPIEPSNVTATNNAGLTSAPTSFTVTADTIAPTTTVTCGGGCAGWHNAATSVTLSAADGGSGVAKILYSTDGTAPSLAYSGPIAISATTTVRFAAVDKVGNLEATKSQQVQVDTSAPSAPLLTLSAGTGSAVTGSTVFYNPAAAGGFSLTASSNDPESGVASYAYPAFGLGWNVSSGAYTFAAGALDPVEPNNVTATNNAGLASAPTSFTVTADTSAPTTSISCSGGCSGWHSAATTVTLSADDGTGSGIDRILYSTDGNAPSQLYTAPITVAATATVKFAAYDRVGNLETTKSQLVQVDTTAPSAPILTLGGATGSAAVTGGVLFFNPASSGGFTVTPTSTDAESGVASYTYPSLGTGWTRTNGTYTFAGGAADPAEPNNVTATNNAGLTSTPTSFTVTADTTAPTTTVTCSGGCAGWHNAATSVTLSATDGGSGVATILYSTDGTNPSITYTGPISVSATTTVKFAALDKVGNLETTKSQLVQVDTTAPSAPSLALGGTSGGAAVSGGTLYFNPASSGGFTVTPTSTDAESGVATYAYPSLGSGWTSTNGAYSFTAGAADPAEPNNVTATNNAGLTSTPTSFTVTADSSAPATTITCNGSTCSSNWYTTTPVSVALSATDSGSGVAKILYSIDGGAPSLTYTGALSLSTTTTVKFAAVDKVGNTEATKTQLVQIDTSAPTAPTLTLGGAGGNAAINSGIVYFNPAGSGGFTVTASSTDGPSGIDHYTFPSLGSGWTNSTSTNTGTYSFAAGATDPAEPNNVTATNVAGLTGAPTSFTVNADATAPTTTATCNGAVCGSAWFTSSPVTFALAATDGASGVDRILYSTNGGTPTLLYSTPLAIASTTTVKFAAYDRVGNLEATNTQLIQVDTTPPSAPSLTFGNLSGAALNGGVLYYNPGSSGGFTVTPSSTDAESGIATYAYPSLGSGWTNTNGAYSFTVGAADPSEPNNVTATNRAGLTSAPTSFTLTGDGTAPTATATCNGSPCSTGWYTTSPVSLALNASDGGSGVASTLYSLDGSAPSLPYSTALNITATTTVAYAVTDKVGNTSTASVTIRVDTTPPSTPALSFSALTNASVTGSSVYYRSGAGGGFTVTPTSSDAESGIASYGFPSLGTGWNGTGGAYTFAAGAQQPLGASSVTATNNAGLTSASAQFTVLRDDTAPATSIRCNGSACGSGFASASVAVTLTANDGTGSGAVKTVYTLDGSDPSPIHGNVYLGGFTLTSSTTVKFRSYDAVGNEEAVGSQLVQIDTTPPTVPVLTLTAPSATEYVNGTTLYYNPSGSNTGTFTVGATASDSESSIAKLHFPAIAGAVGGGDTTASSATYTWDATTTGSGPQAVTAYNGSGLTSSATFTLTPDTTAPSGGSVSYPDGFQPSGAVTITTTDGTDGGAGIDPASRTLERQTAPLANGTCGTWSGWSAVTSPDTVPDATCARYRYRVVDRVGNVQIYTSTNTVKVDAGAPSTLLLTLNGTSAGEFVNGTTLFYNPSGTNSGSFTVNASTSAASGIARVTFPSLTGMTGGGDVTASPYTTTYGWTQASSASGAQTVTAKSNAGGSSTATFTVTPDSAAPTGQTAALVGGPWFTSTSISITTTNGSDALSGIAPATALIERASATLANGTCGAFGAYGGSYTSPDTTVVSGNCYRYRFSIADKVGNRSTPVQTGVAMVDTSAPTTPSLAFSALNHASVTGSTAFYNSNTSGSFTVTSTASDPQSGISSTSFPTFGSGWSGTGGLYNFAAGAADPTEPNNVVATNGAGLNSSAATFVVTADGDAPAGGSVSYTDGYRTSASVPMNLANGSDALSGVDAASAVLQRASATMTEGACGTFGSWTTIATAPTLAYTDTSVSSGNCYVYRYVVSDKVGNTVTWTTTSVAKIDTNAPTATLADPGANLRLTVNLASTTADTGGSGVATVTYQRSDATGWVTIPAAWDTTTVADGLYDLRVVVTDRAGNSTTSAVISGRRVDNTAPGAAIADPGANLRGTVTLSSVTSDSGSGVASVTYQRSDPTGWVTIPTTWDTTTAPDGLYDLRVVVLDVAGNQAIGTVTGRRVDNTAPAATMGSLDSPVRGTVTLSSNTSDGGSGIATVVYERQPVGSTGWVATPASFDTATVADGDYDIHVVATDAAGNSTTSDPVRTHIDNTSPRPTSVTPNSGASSVATDVTVTATFPRTMLAGSITASSFTLTTSGASVAASVAYDSSTRKATLTPAALLSENATYTATLTTAVTAQDGASLYQPYTWSFSTGVMPPTVTAKSPSAGATGVATTVAPTATFSRAMDQTTISGTTVTLSSSSGLVAASVAYDATSRTVTLTPSGPLANGVTYTMQLSSAIKSQDGQALAATSWTFTTVSGAPAIVSKTPTAAANGVATATSVAAAFNRDMKASTLTTSTVTLTGPSGPVTATVTYDATSDTAKLTPAAPLASGTTYTATVSGSVQSSAGVPMGSDATWTFTTTTGPEVWSTTPADGATGVAMSIVPTVQMSMAVDATTVTSTNVKLIRPDTTLVSISVAYNATSHVITITPTSPLDYSGTFTIRLETGITAGGVPMSAQFNATFTTTGTGVATRINAGSTTAYTATSGNVFSADTGFIGGTARTVTNTITGTTDPTLYKSERTGTWQYAINVPNGTYDLKLHFVELTSTACNQRIFSVDVLNTTLVNDISNMDIFCQVGANKPNIKTISGVMVSARSLRLKAVAGTVGTPEIAAIEIIPHAPTATPSTPAAGATGVGVGTTVSAVFSQAMDAASLTPSTVTLTGPGGAAVPATVAYDSASKTVTLTPSAPLAHGTAYTARLDASIRDSFGLLAGSPSTWTFTTG
jgi:hypothetical protein